MKPFDIEKAKQGEPVCTRDGRSARILAFDIKNRAYSLAVVITRECGEEEVYEYTADGNFIIGETNPADLYHPSKNVKGWVNVYGSPEREMLGHVYNTEDEAKGNIGMPKYYIRTMYVEYEED